MSGPLIGVTGVTGHAGATYHLTGREALTLGEAAAGVTAVSGRATHGRCTPGIA